jgi:vacuolar-type H+-ATPase subunit I/STV1
MPAKRQSDAGDAGRSQAFKKCKVVHRGIAAAELPETVKDLLESAVLENSLAVPPDTRHAFQARMVAAVGAIIEGLEGGMQKAVEEKDAEIKATEEEKAKQEAAAAVKEKELEGKKEVTQAKKKLLADATIAFRAAKDGLVAAQQAQKEGDAELEAVGAKLETLEKAVTESIKPLVEAGTESAPLKPLMKLLTDHEFNESMLTALPGAVAKTPDQRGPFDTLVVQELNDEVAKRLDAMKATISGGAKDKADRAAVVSKAEAAVKAAKEKLISDAKTFEAVKAEETSVDEALEVINEAITEAKNTAKNANKAFGKAKTALTKFQNGPQLAFTDLRDGKKEEDEAAEAEPAEEAAPETSEAPAAVA